MSSFFSSDGSFSLQFAIIFLVIFVILAVGLFALRSLRGKGVALSSKAAPRGRQPRLGIVDIYELDRQRQLILLRRDNVEHLLLVGGPNDVVIERNITRGLSARLDVEETTEAEPSVAPAPDFGQPPASVPYLEPQREPTFEMPVVVPPPVPGSDAPPPLLGRPLDLSARPEPEAGPAYEPSAPEPVPVVARRESALSRVIRRTPPPLANLVPGAGAERVRLPEAPRVPAPESSEEAPVPNPVRRPETGRAIDAAILSDMARQLEEALRRPSAAVRPASPPTAAADAVPFVADAMPAEPEPATVETAPTFVSPPETEETERAAEIDPVAAAMATTAEPTQDVAETETAPLPDEAAPEPEPTSHEPVAPPSEIAPVEEPHLEPVEPAPAPAPEEPLAPPPVPPAPEPAPPVVVEPAPSRPATPPKAATSPNPFSVEEIEAEFARLLGRPLDRKG